MSNKISNKKLEASVKLDQSLSKASGKIVEKVEQLGRTSSNKTTVLSHSKTIQDVVKGALEPGPPPNSPAGVVGSQIIERIEPVKKFKENLGGKTITQ